MDTRSEVAVPGAWVRSAPDAAESSANVLTLSRLHEIRTIESGLLGLDSFGAMCQKALHLLAAHRAHRKRQ